jgi:hypothetical protein
MIANDFTFPNERKVTRAMPFRALGFAQSQITLKQFTQNSKQFLLPTILAF